MTTLTIIAIVLVVLGIIGSIVPALPGPVLGFIGLIMLFFEKSGSVSVSALIWFGAFVVLLTVLDYLIPVLGAKFMGATKKGIAGAIIGGFLGLLFFPPLGIFIGAVAGAITGEYFSGKRGNEMLRAALGVVAGSFFMLFAQLILSVALAIYFFTSLF